MNATQLTGWSTCLGNVTKTYTVDWLVNLLSFLTGLLLFWFEFIHCTGGQAVQKVHLQVKNSSYVHVIVLKLIARITTKKQIKKLEPTLAVNQFKNNTLQVKLVHKRKKGGR